MINKEWLKDRLAESRKITEHHECYSYAEAFGYLETVVETYLNEGGETDAK